MKTVGLLAFILVIIGGINWGLVGFFKYDLVATIFGDMTTMSRAIYGLIGLAALAKLAMWKKHCCMKENKA